MSMPTRLRPVALTIGVSLHDPMMSVAVRLAIDGAARAATPR
jgi:hypothetical protein